MKNNNYRMHHPKLDKEIERADRQFKHEARALGQATGKRSLPALKGDSLEVYTETLDAGYQGLIAKIYEYIQTNLDSLDGELDGKLAEQRIQETVSEMQAIDQKNLQAEDKLGEVNPLLIMIQLFIAELVPAIMAWGETLFNAKSLQVVGDVLLTTFSMALTLSAGVWSFAHLTPYLIRKAPYLWQKYAIGGIAIFLVAAVFSVLSYFRIAFLESYVSIEIPPAYFVIINLFVFLASAGIIFWLFPSREETHAAFQEFWVRLWIWWRNLRKNKSRRNKNEIEDRQADIAKAKEALRTLGKSKELEVVSKRKEANGIFKQKNILYRSDGLPDCFDHKLLELELNFNNHQNKKS
ncbi:MAG: hypothetical protein IIA45_03805 [Bacteroidetes bacterium]|nr:hypothetical protein [Bacteroidota bacterium]